MGAHFKVFAMISGIATPRAQGVRDSRIPRYDNNGADMTQDRLFSRQAGVSLLTVLLVLVVLIMVLVIHIN